MDVRYLCFDMDGTLLKTDRGVAEAIRRVVGQMGIDDVIPYEQPELYIGPSTGEFGQSMGWDADMIREFNDHLVNEQTEVQIGMTEVYPGIRELLEATQNAGYVNYVCTAKNETAAAQLSEHFGLAPYIQEVIGAKTAEDNKTTILARLIAEEKIDPSEVVMIGDRYTDLLGGRENKTRTIGVLYGYGPKEELESLEPDAICDTVEDLREYLIQQK